MATRLTAGGGRVNKRGGGGLGVGGQLSELASECLCLDTGVGLNRADAHRVYLNTDMAMKRNGKVVGWLGGVSQKWTFETGSGQLLRSRR